VARGGIALRVDLIQADEGDRRVEIAADQLAGWDFEDRDVGTDVGRLALHNHDMRWYDEGAFRAGQKLEVAWGWADDLGEPRRLIVKKPSSGANPVTITLHDEGALLDLTPQRRLWSGRTDSGIARAILAEHGYTGLLCDVANTTDVREGVTQVGTNAAFLTTLARRNGYRWWIDAAGAHWGPRPLAAVPCAAFDYRHDFGVRILGEPQIEANLAKDVAKIRVEAIDPRTRQPVSATVGAADADDAFVTPLVALGNEQEVADPDSPDGARAARVSRLRVVHLGAATADDVRAAADCLYRETALARYKMRVEVLGDRTLGAKQLHHWTFPSESMSGLWYCRRAATKVGAGQYTMTLEYVKDALGKLFLERALGVNRSRNPALDENGQPVDTTGLKKVTTITEENGREYPAYHWVDAKGESVGTAQVMTTAEWSDLTAEDRAALKTASAGALALPGR
jgi:hypothetical protein